MKFSKTQFLSLAFVVILIGIASIIMVTYLSSDPDSAKPSPTPVTPIPIQKVKPLSIKDAPTAPPEKGGGIDTNSPIIKSSISEIEKLNDALPFERDFTTSEGVDVSIVIPQQSLQTNAWTLKTQIFGINYNTSPDQNDYEIMRKSFLEAANSVFLWIRQNNIDPEKIIYVWGDRSFIQNQAENWLSSQN